MKGTKIILYVLCGLAILLAAAIPFALVADDILPALKNPEWTKFRDEMMHAYPEIDRISYTDVGADFSIRYQMNNTIDWDKIEEVFEKTRDFMLSEQGFETVKSLKEGSLGGLKVRFIYKNNKKDNVEFFSYCSKSECTAQDFTAWTVYYRDELWDYQEKAD